MAEHTSTMRTHKDDMWIADRVAEYAGHHEVSTEAVGVDRAYEDGRLTEIRLTLDIDGQSHGCDETIARD